MVVNKKVALLTFGLAVATFAGALIERRTMADARGAIAALIQLQPDLNQGLATMIQGVHERAKQQQQWLRQGELGPENEESRKIGAALAQLLAIRFDSPDAFEQADRLQTSVSDSLARMLASGALSRELFKKIERLDMSAQRQRAEYFRLVQDQHKLLNTPLVRRAAQEHPGAFTTALTFPSERTLLDAAP